MPRPKNSTLARTLRYLRRFGPRAGLSAAQFLRRKNTVVPVRLPGIAHPIHVRAGTSDVETFEEVFVAREYELPFADFAPAHILDLGANVGYASIYFADRWPQARILAVEPASSNTGLLEQNTHPWPQIACLEGAVWAHPALVCVTNPGTAANAYRMTEAVGSTAESVPAYTVSQLIARTGAGRIDLLKMDVEGAEAEIFRDDTSWLDRVGVMVVELHDRIVPGCAEALNHALQGRHFRQEIVGANLAFDFR